MTSKADIARKLGVSRAAVTRWHRRGMPCDDAAAALAWHQSNIRSRRKRREAPPAAKAPSPPPQAVDPAADPATRSWRDRLDAANARIREAELAKLRGELIDARETRRTIADAIGSFRQRLRSIPSAMAPRLLASGSPGALRDLLQDEIDCCLHDLADMVGRALPPNTARKGNGDAD